MGESSSKLHSQSPAPPRRRGRCLMCCTAAAMCMTPTARRRWHAIPGRDGCDSFEESWKLKSWSRKARLIFMRSLERQQDKEPVQLDLFRPPAASINTRSSSPTRACAQVAWPPFTKGAAIRKENIFGRHEAGRADGLPPVSSALRQRDVAAGVDARAQPRSRTPALRTARTSHGDDETHGDVGL